MNAECMAPNCGRPEIDGAIDHVDGCPLSGPVEQVRQSCTTVYAHVEFAGPGSARAAFDAVLAGETTNCGYWRHASLDRRRWFVSIAGPDEAADQVKQLAAVAVAAGGGWRVDADTIGADGLEAMLRQMRFRHIVSHAAGGPGALIRRLPEGLAHATVDQTGQAHIHVRRPQG